MRENTVIVSNFLSLFLFPLKSRMISSPMHYQDENAGIGISFFLNIQFNNLRAKIWSL